MHRFDDQHDFPISSPRFRHICGRLLEGRFQHQQIRFVVQMDISIRLGAQREIIFLVLGNQQAQIVEAEVVDLEDSRCEEL